MYVLNGSGLEFQQEQETFLQNVEPIWPPVPVDTGILSLGIKRPVSVIEHSPVFSVEVKNGWSCSSGPLIRLHSEDREGATFGFLPYVRVYLFVHSANFTLFVRQN